MFPKDILSRLFQYNSHILIPTESSITFLATKLERKLLWSKAVIKLDMLSESKLFNIQKTLAQFGLLLLSDLDQLEIENINKTLK